MGEKLKIAMLGQKRVPSHEGGIEIVVEELSTRMAAKGHGRGWCTSFSAWKNSSKV